MGWKTVTFTALNGVMFVALFLLLDLQGAAIITKGNWEYKDLIAILLSVVSIIVTFVGIIVAVAAIWGFQTLKAMAEEKAIEVSKTGSAKYLHSDEFAASIRAQVDVEFTKRAQEAVQDALAPVIVPADMPDHQAGDQPWQD